VKAGKGEGREGCRERYRQGRAKIEKDEGREG